MYLWPLHIYGLQCHEYNRKLFDIALAKEDQWRWINSGHIEPDRWSFVLSRLYMASRWRPSWIIGFLNLLCEYIIIDSFVKVLVIKWRICNTCSVSCIVDMDNLGVWLRIELQVEENFNDFSKVSLHCRAVWLQAY